MSHDLYRGGAEDAEREFETKISAYSVPLR
jgi:hypothetical protein